MNVLLLLLGFIILAFFLFRVLVGLTGWAIRRTIESRHKAAETILESRQPPPEWIPTGVTGLNEAQKKACLSRLEALIAYFKKSPFVADEETREELLGQLQDIYGEWQASTSR